MRLRLLSPLLPAMLAVMAPVLAPVPAAARPVVVELYTSQSCSSCPPAEALLGRLARENSPEDSPADADLLPLAFHVTYWDHLDWRDPYALPAATARQQAYAERFGDATYTPQAVVDGRAGLVGSDETALRAAIARARAAAGAEVPVTLARTGAGLTVRVGEGGGPGTVLLVGFDPSHTTRVGRGENAGRTIAQANVVRSVAEIGRWTGPAATFTVPVPAGETAAAIIQAPDGRILGAARLDARSADAEAGR